MRGRVSSLKSKELLDSQNSCSMASAAQPPFFFALGWKNQRLLPYSAQLWYHKLAYNLTLEWPLSRFTPSWPQTGRIHMGFSDISAEWESSKERSPYFLHNPQWFIAPTQVFTSRPAIPPWFWFQAAAMRLVTFRKRTAWLKPQSSVVWSVFSSLFRRWWWRTKRT